MKHFLPGGVAPFSGARPRHPSAAGHRIEPLEPRRLLSAALGQPIGAQVFAQGSGTESGDLTGVFYDTNGQSDLAFSATSSNPSVVSASISGSTITLSPGLSGFAVIHMTARAPDQTSASNAFRVQITATAARLLDVSLGSKLKSLHFAASSNATANVALKGPGTAVIDMGGDGLKLDGSTLHGANQELENITLSGTTAASSLVITGRGGNRFAINIGNISSDGALGLLEVNGASLLGDVSIAGGIHAIKSDVAEDGTINAGSSPVTVQGISFVDENFASTGTVRSVSMGQWLDSDDVPETFSAVNVQRLSARGSFQPGLQVTGVLGSAKINGAVGGTWNVNRAATPVSVGSTGFNWSGTFTSLPGMSVRQMAEGSLTAPSLHFFTAGRIFGATLNLTAAGTMDLPLLTAGSIVNSGIFTSGSIGKVESRDLYGSTLYAGLTAEVFPASASDFANPATISSIVLRGTGKAPATLGFAGSFVSATNLGTLSLGTTQTNDNGLIYGIAARSIGRLTVKDTTRAQTISLKAVHDPATLAAQLTAEKVQLNHLTFRII